VHITCVAGKDRSHMRLVHVVGDDFVAPADESGRGDIEVHKQGGVVPNVVLGDAVHAGRRARELGAGDGKTVERLPLGLKVPGVIAMTLLFWTWSAWLVLRNAAGEKGYSRKNERYGAQTRRVKKCDRSIERIK